MFGGINVWFAFADATGSIVGAVILYLLVPRLHGWKWLWLLVIPTISYGAGPRSFLEANGHRADERLKLSDLDAATRIVALSLADILRK